MISKQENLIQKAVILLKSARVIIIPTETVYGLAVNAEDYQAVNKLIAIKNRNPAKVIATAITDITMANKLAIVSQLAKKLINQFWPGPLTIVIPASKLAKEKLPHLLSKGYIGLRCPNNTITQKILSHFNYGLAMTSANISGHKNANNVNEIDKKIMSQISLTINDGQSKLQQESSVIKITNQDKIILLRNASLDIRKITSSLSDNCLIN